MILKRITILYSSSLTRLMRVKSSTRKHERYFFSMMCSAVRMDIHVLPSRHLQKRSTDSWGLKEAIKE